MNFFPKSIYLLKSIGKSFFLRLDNRTLATDVGEKTIFVIHFHYVEQLWSLLPLVTRVSNTSHVVVTSSDDEVLEIVSSAGLLSKKVPNIGRNFGGLMDDSVMNWIAEKDIVVHLHGKKSKHSPVFGFFWNYILWSYLTNAKVLEKVVKKMAGESAWVAFPNLTKVFSKYSAGWGSSASHLERLPYETRHRLKGNPHFIFPMGGMFVCDLQLITELKSVFDEIPYGFKEEPIRNDGELPHFLERLIGVVAYNHGGIHFL